MGLGLALALQLGLPIQYLATTTPNVFVTKANHLHQPNLLDVIAIIGWKLAFAIQIVAMASGTQVYAVAHQQQTAHQQQIGAHRQEFRCLQCCWLWVLIYFSPQKFNKFDWFDWFLRIWHIHSSFQSRISQGKKIIMKKNNSLTCLKSEFLNEIVILIYCGYFQGSSVRRWKQWRT